MKIYNNKKVRSLVFILLYIVFTFVGLYSLYKHEDYLDILIGIFFGFGLPAAYFIGYKTLLTLNAESKKVIITRPIINRYKEVEIEDIKEINITFFIVGATISLEDDKNVLITDLSSFFKSKKDFLVFFEELKKINPNIKDNINWDSFPVKYMIW